MLPSRQLAFPAQSVDHVANPDDFIIFVVGEAAQLPAVSADADEISFEGVGICGGGSL
jgi:hypothetical protein